MDNKFKKTLGTLTAASIALLSAHAIAANISFNPQPTHTGAGTYTVKVSNDILSDCYYMGDTANCEDYESMGDPGQTFGAALILPRKTFNVEFIYTTSKGTVTCGADFIFKKSKNVYSPKRTPNSACLVPGGNWDPEKTPSFTFNCISKECK